MVRLARRTCRRHDAAMAPDRKPGDLLLDRFLPEADASRREQALAAFLAYGRQLRALGSDLEQLKATEGGASAGAENRAIMTEPSPPQ